MASRVARVSALDVLLRLGALSAQVVRLLAVASWKIVLSSSKVRGG